MPTFRTEEELKQFLIDKPKETNGIFEAYTDNELVYTVNVVNGDKSGGRVLLQPEQTPSGDYPCTFKGIKKCAIDSIHAQNWYEMIICVGQGIGCVQHYYIVCTIDNC